MKISIDEQMANDFDWFGIDRDGFIFHVASGPGILPVSVAQSRRGLDEMSESIMSLEDSQEDLLYSDRFVLQLLGLRPKRQDIFMKSWLKMAKKGVSSFDKSKLNDTDNFEYHLMCRPNNLLSVSDVLGGLGIALRKTKTTFSLKETTSFNLREIGIPMCNIDGQHPRKG